MGNCAASRLVGLAGGAGDEDDPVALCRERKRLLKAAVDRRYALATAHASYIHSLNAVAAAIDVFVSRHSAPTPILITLPSSTSASDDVQHHHLLSPPQPPSSSNALKHTPSEAKVESLAYQQRSPARCLTPESSSDDDEPPTHMSAQVQADAERYFFSTAAATAPPMQPTPAEEAFGWDFFNPFDGMRMAEDAATMMGSFGRSSDEDLRAVREEEGIPELEEADEVEEGLKPAERDIQAAGSKKVAALGSERDIQATGSNAAAECGGGGAEEKGLTVAEETQGRELLQALREVEDHFIRAYDSGKEVSKMLEANRVHLQTGIEEMKENAPKMIQAITWHRSPSSLSSSSRSQLASSSNSTSWTESKSDIFDDYGGMESGSHSQTLGRLYAWEKKLYEEVKTGDCTRQAYEKKCMQLRNKDARGADSRSVDKTRAAVRDLYTRIFVALRAAETISEKIQKLRDEELQPQLIELLQGLMRSWKIMLESHEAQKQIMFEVNAFTCPAYGKFCNDSQRLATITLEAELRNWRTCYIHYFAAQKAYVEALDGWLSKFLLPDVEYYSRARSLYPSHGAGAPPLIVICHEWLTSLGRLPDKPVACGMRNFVRTVRFLWVKQGEEQQQKRRVDSLAKELDNRIHAFQKAENKILESKLSENNHEPDVRQRLEYLAGRKEILDVFRRKLESEKAKHQNCMRETHEVTLNGFKIGLASIFESLTEFSRDSLSLYDGLLVHHGKTKSCNETSQNPSCMEDLHRETEGENR